MKKIDGGKRIKGRKRHIVLHVEVHRANESDTKAACRVLERSQENYPTIQAFSGDAGYRGTAVTFVNESLNLTLYYQLPQNEL